MKDVFMISSIIPEMRMKLNGNSGKARTKDDDW